MDPMIVCAADWVRKKNPRLNKRRTRPFKPGCTLLFKSLLTRRLWMIEQRGRKQETNRNRKDFKAIIKNHFPDFQSVTLNFQCWDWILFLSPPKEIKCARMLIYAILYI